MRFKVERYHLEIVPENPVDEAYLEEVLGLHEDEQQAAATRISATGLPHSWGYLRIAKKDED